MQKLLLLLSATALLSGCANSKTCDFGEECDSGESHTELIDIPIGGLDVPYLSQHDLGSISEYACSSASIAMILAYHGEISADHDAMVEAAQDAFDATATKDDGLLSRGGLTDYLVDDWGFSSAVFDFSGYEELYNVIRSEIDQGRPLILGSRSMSEGHYIVVTGYEGDDYDSATLIVNDPFGEWHSWNYWTTSTSGDGLHYDFTDITADPSDGVFIIVP